MLSMDPETPEQVVDRLGRAYDHVTEQIRVEHAMTLHWQARALAAEQQLARLQKKADRAQQSRDTPTSRPADGVHAPVDLIEGVTT